MAFMAAAEARGAAAERDFGEMGQSQTFGQGHRFQVSGGCILGVSHCRDAMCLALLVNRDQCFNTCVERYQPSMERGQPRVSPSGMVAWRSPGIIVAWKGGSTVTRCNCIEEMGRGTMFWRAKSIANRLWCDSSTEKTILRTLRQGHHSHAKGDYNI
jgi:hypothetical protein